MPDIEIENLTKSFGGSKVLDHISFTVRDKEFVTLLGPSGCGKTTTLMCIAGLQSPDEGLITCGDETFVDRQAGIDQPAERRNLGIVFQSYALWPHMTVAQNVAFPLRLRKVAKQAMRDRVAEVLAIVELKEHGGRYPHQLSGGQQQRVALARALAYSPRVLLLDEPFSNLDAKLRERARDRLKEVQHTLGLTTVFVTHDQSEALSMSDRIMVMNGGRILRYGSPEEVYRQPGARFAAEFLGRCNFLTGRVTASPDGDSILITPEFPAGVVVRGRHAGLTATVAIRPEDIEISELDGTGPGTEGTVLDASYLGDHYQYLVAVGTMHLGVHSQRQLAYGPVRLRIPPGTATFVE
ncbi:MAG TPA: ABC transporter ATP-binding protein [Trebonia sp.]